MQKPFHAHNTHTFNEHCVINIKKLMRFVRLIWLDSCACLRIQCGAMQERVAGLEQALAQVSGVAETKCAEVTSRALALAEAHVAEVSQLRSDLASAKAEAAITAQLRQQVVLLPHPAPAMSLLLVLANDASCRVTAFEATVLL